MAAEVRQLLVRGKGLTNAARQAPRLLRLPPALDSAISKFLEEYSSGELKKNVSRLSATLRKIGDPLGAQSKLRENEAAGGSEAAQEALEEFTKSRQARVKKVKVDEPLVEESILYTEKSTAAYVAARMPAIYGAIHRVLSEVSRRIPDFRPSHILDFGSGPGTALWASNEVWPEIVKTANLVEPSEFMSAACRGLLIDVQNFPRIKSYPSLLDLSKSIRRGRREHDLVIASYTLGELPTKEDRISAVRQLWSFTSDILVLIEPGTPQGSANVREVRSHILQMEKKKLRRQTRGPQMSKDGKPVIPDLEGKDTTAAQQIPAGAYVVAPCSHDGACPMDGLSIFCHFSQRVQRTSLQRITKRHSSAALRAYEDEKYSFIVLRRGIRLGEPWPLSELQEKLKNETSEELEDSFEFVEFDSASDFFDDSSMETVSDSEVESDSESPDLEAVKAETGDQSANLSTGWAPIIRRPLSRGRHVLLDVCRSADMEGSKGSLNRVIWAKKSKLAQHLRAKKLMWGDLWPC
ncbi:unnamed protein product [Calypogeia fissa]